MIRKSFFQFAICCLFILTGLISYGQNGDQPAVVFAPYENQLFGFDAFSVPEWKDNYHVSVVADSNEYNVAYKSVVAGYTDSVNIVLPSSVDYASLAFVISDSTFELEHIQRSTDTFTIVLPIMDESYSLDVLVNGELMGKLRVIVYPEHIVDVVIVPIIRTKINSDSLESYLNRVYQQAGLTMSLNIEPYFKTTEFQDSLLSNPSPDNDRFTDQMIEIRNEYFEEHPNQNKQAYYIFLVNGFVNDQQDGYSVRNKAVSFIKYEVEDLHRVVANQLGYGIGTLEDTWNDNGPDKGTSNNLMDIDGIDLTYAQWESIQLMYKVVSYYDDYEDVKTNNGIIAYYLWEEDKEGNIILSAVGLKKSLRRPYKRNTYSLHLDIDNFLFVQLFTIFQYPICFLHILSLAVLAFLSVYLRRKVLKRSERIRKYRLLRWGLRFSMFVVFLFAYYGIFIAINEGYYMYEVHQGELKHLSGMNAHDVSQEIGSNINVRRSQEEKMGSEVLIKQGNKWILEKRKRVLYFNLQTNSDGKTVCTFVADSDTLILRTKRFKKFAFSHYFVFSYLDEDGNYTDQKAYNHLGVDITDKLTLKDPAKRILLFVNGYRPTSLGKTFEENFDDVLNNGLEFMNSKNLVYSFDRYSYWKPWNEINLTFEKRLNPSESYYADGHHSVSTSNHRSLIDFTSLTSTYPKRCENPKHHVCKKGEKGWALLGLSREVNTVELFDLKPNRKGFDLRFENGKIAGRNLNQIFNELPNKSKNDTLYIVSHSMGYAYALGIIEKLRGKINFGGLYIIAPENASVGSVDPKEWKEVWQYGSDFEANQFDAPCLLDGIAPQTKVGGLSPRQRAYIPEENYKKMGFFNSHFIGNYTWIFDLNKDEVGFINQR